MRRLWSTLGCAAVAAALAMPALALDPPPITVPTLPTVSVPTPPPPPPPPPTPTVSVPPVPLPTPKPAAPPAPRVQTPVTKPPARPSSPSQPASPARPASPTGSVPAHAPPSSPASSSAGAAPARTPPRVRASRAWASRGSKRATTIVLTVPRAAVVDLRVMQLAPLCRAAGRIVVHARGGRNAVPFRGRVQGRALPAGTYRITPRVRGGRTLKPIVVVVVAGAAPARGEVAFARRANVCRAAGASRAPSGADAASSSSPLASSAGLRSRAASVKKPTAADATAVASPKPKAQGGILGAEFTQPLRNPTEGANPLVLALLALAIGLLALAALPRTVVASPLLAEQLTNRRLELALAGTATLLVVVLAYLFLV